VVDERIRCVIQLQDGESMASLCREFVISRKAGDKILDRYQERGLEGLKDRARRPHRYANSLPEQRRRQPSSLPSVRSRAGAQDP
jgi:Helix-turn-helix domain